MRSYRHKKHRAHDPVTAHCVGKEYYWRGWYPMRTKLTTREYYRIMHDPWWSTVHRWDYRFVTQYDRDNYVFSNMKYTKLRIPNHYIMYRF